VLLAVAGLGCAEAGVADVSFELRAGEILGLAGLVGSGRSELARTLFGLTPADAGRIEVGGAAVRIDSAQQAIDLGLAYVPEDRRRHGMIGELSCVHNTTLAVLGAVSRRGLLDTAAEEHLTLELATRLDVRTPSIHTPTGNLSGGNQQKVALARWLAARPRIFLVDEPTQGVDVGAKAEIHRILADLAAAGQAVLLISSELPEILGLSDRVGVMRNGRLVAVLDRAEATQERILTLALGQREEAAA
jgi:rhamnose transport system ATP-binding protein